MCVRYFDFLRIIINKGTSVNLIKIRKKSKYGTHMVVFICKYIYTDDDRKVYIGACETTFKERYRNHVKDIKQRKYIKSTELSKYVWSLKDEGKNPYIYMCVCTIKPVK